MQKTGSIRLAASVVMAAALLFAGCKKETPQKTETPPPAPPATEQAVTGESLFKQHCAVCHPDGGNVVKPEYTLHGKSLAAHKITKPEDIVRIMRNPDEGMTKFDEQAIPEKDAMEIAKYVLESFK